MTFFKYPRWISCAKIVSKSRNTFFLFIYWVYPLVRRNIHNLSKPDLCIGSFWFQHLFPICIFEIENANFISQELEIYNSVSRESFLFIFLLHFLSAICHEKNNNCRERHDIVCCILYIYHDYIILFSHPCLNMQYPILSHLYGLADDEKLRRNKMKLWEDEIIWPRCINIKSTFLKGTKC